MSKTKRDYGLLRGLTQQAIAELRRAYQRKTKVGLPKTEAEKQAWAYYYAVRRKAVKAGKIKVTVKPRKKHDLDWYISHNRVKGLAIGDKICYYHTRRTGELQSRTKRDENMYEEWRTLKTEWREVRRENGYERTEIEKWFDPNKRERLIDLEEQMKHRKDLIGCKKAPKKPKKAEEVEDYEKYH